MRKNNKNVLANIDVNSVLLLKNINNFNKKNYLKKKEIKLAK